MLNISLLLRMFVRFMPFYLLIAFELRCNCHQFLCNQRKQLTPLIQLFTLLFLVDTIDRRLMTFEPKICRQYKAPI